MSDLVVRPIRFTDNIEPMRAFLETLGLRPRIEAESGAWVDMVSSGGMLALHSARESVRGAPSGLTALGFEADDVARVAERLTVAGVRGVSVYDEAYGKALVCVDPLGDQLVIDERADDLYGYREHAPTGVAPGLRVMAVRYVDPQGDYSAFLEALGLKRRGEPNPHFVAFTSGGGDHGVVGLHRITDGHPAFASESTAVDLSFETDEDLARMADRLIEGGYQASLRVEAFGQVLSTVDADGLGVEVHQTSGA